MQGAQVPGDVLPHAPVAPGRPADEYPVLVQEGDGQAVDLHLAGKGPVRRIRVRHGPPHPGQERRQLPRVEDVVEREHRAPVLDLAESLQDRAADAPGRGIGPGELRMLLFQVGQLPDQGVVVRIGELGSVLFVIETRVMCDELDQLLHPLGNASGRVPRALSAGRQVGVGHRGLQAQAFGFIAGKRMTSRMERASVRNITSRSMPIPMPPVGGSPDSMALMKSSSKS